MPLRLADVQCLSCGEWNVDALDGVKRGGNQLCAWCRPRVCQECGREWCAEDDPEFDKWHHGDQVPGQCYGCRHGKAAQ